MHVALGHTLDAVTEIRVDEKVAWSGRVTSNTALTINKPDLFGGQQKEGGLVGTVQVLLGKDNQVLPVAAANRYGRAPNDCPAFRGLTTLFFHGNGIVSTGRANDWSLLAYAIDAQGQPTYNGEGFLWKSNSPVIAQKIEATGVRAPKGLSPSLALSADDDANFVHIIYECLTDDDWGMGGLPSLIDTANFEAEAARLADEGMFGSVWWMRQSTIEDFVVEMIDHIQATLFLNPNTGLLSIKLLRDDYDLDSLRHITPQNATLSNFKRRSAGEIVNEMTVDWTNPQTEQTESITAQDIASIQSQGGEKVSGSRNYYAFRNKELAIKTLQRDLRSSTAPLISADAALDRSAWDLLPGEVVLMSWPKRSTYSAVMRVGKVSYGKPLDTKIRASMLQDVFSLARPPIALLPETEWPDPRVDPQPLAMQLFTVPAYFARNAEIQSDVVELLDTEALVGALADAETYDSLDYELVSESVTAEGGSVFTSKGAMSMTALGYLSTTMVAAAVSTLPATIFPVLDEAPRVGGFVVLGYGDANQEFCLVLSQSDAGWNLGRGTLDTVPKTWAAGTPVWVVNPGAKIVDTQTIHGEGTTATYRGLDRTARGLLSVGDAPPVSTTVTNRPHLPLRPANVKVNGVGFSSTAIGSASTVTISWATRNRELEDTQVLRWTDGPVQPEHRQETVVQVFDATDNTLIVEYGSLWTDTQLVFQKTDFDRFASVRFVVIARRDDQVSLNGHAVTVTGFANNPAASLPPAAPDRTEPPSFDPAPAVGAFVCEATANVSVDGSQVPTITFSGTQDRLEATMMTYRWRVAGSGDQFYLGRTVPLNRERVEFSEAGVPGATELEVGVAYVSSAGPGIWRTLPNVTTLAYIASDVAPGAPIALLAAANTDQLAEELLRGVLFRAYADARLYLAGQPISTVVSELVEQVITADGSLVQKMNLLGARNADGTGFNLAADRVFISAEPGGGSEVVSVRSLQLTTADLNAFIESRFRVSEEGAEAATLLSVNGRVIGTRTTNDGTIGSFQVQTDVFAFVDPDGANPVVPFSYGTDNILRLTDTIINGDLIVTGSINGRDKIEQDTVTPIVASYIGGSISLSGTSYTQVAEQIIVCGGGPIMLRFNALIDMTHEPASSFTFFTEMRRIKISGAGPDDYQVVEESLDGAGDTADNVSGKWPLDVLDRPGPGTWRYVVNARSTASNMTRKNVLNRFMSAMELATNS